MFKTFERHVLTNLIMATSFITLILVGIVMLTQSVKFLEIILEASAPTATFFTMIMLALPRFLEVVLPIASFAAVIYIYSKMLSDSEITIMRNAGNSSLKLSSPALATAFFITAVIFIISAWIAPASLAKLQSLKHVIRAQYSTLILKEGVFSSISDGLTFYIREKTDEGKLLGLMVYDKREKNQPPSLITAESGIGVTSGNEQQIIVYNGSRQQINPESGALSTLKFERYNIAIPSSKGPLEERWKEPNERTLIELLNTDFVDKTNQRFKKELLVETHRRFATPFLSISFTLIGLCFMLLSPLKRRGYSTNILLAAGTMVVIQSAYLAAYSIAKDHFYGLIMMYSAVILPTLCGLIMLSPLSEEIRRKLLFGT